MKDKIAHVFKTHPTVTELFATSDEMLFFKESDADAHAQDLKDKKVTPIKKGADEAEKKAVDEKAKKEAEAKAKAEKK